MATLLEYLHLVDTWRDSLALDYNDYTLYFECYYTLNIKLYCLCLRYAQHLLRTLLTNYEFIEILSQLAGGDHTGPLNWVIRIMARFIVITSLRPNSSSVETQSASSPVHMVSVESSAVRLMTPSSIIISMSAYLRDLV